MHLRLEYTDPALTNSNEYDTVPKSNRLHREISIKIAGIRRKLCSRRKIIRTDINFVQQTLSIVQAILAILLVAEVLIQQRGSGLGAAFGGAGEIYGVRRGAEKFVFTATIVTAVLFLAVSLWRGLLAPRL